jgi:glycosyltransferase involved in cell wall biosynthesis
MTGEHRPVVTVVIPTRDRVGLLTSHAVPSALGQEDVSLEVIVVDDGSTDGTAAAVEAIGDKRLKLLRHTQPGGVSAARNTGIAAAAGTWIAFLDDDDLWSPRKLRAQLDAAEAIGSRWVYAASFVVDEQTRPLYAHPMPDAAAIAVALESGNVVPAGPSNVMVRADLMRQVGDFDVTLAQGEDWDVWLRLAKTEQPAVCDEVLVATLSHGERSIHRYPTDVLDHVFRMLRKHRPLTRSDKLGATEWLAGQHRQAGHSLRASALHLRAAILYRSPGNLLAALGVLGGERGTRLTSALLLRARGVSHLERGNPSVIDEPDWLARYRTT